MTGKKVNLVLQHSLEWQHTNTTDRRVIDQVVVGSHTLLLSLRLLRISLVLHLYEGPALRTTEKIEREKSLKIRWKSRQFLL